MVIVLTGGGSGGHITPLLAVAAELKRQQPKARLVYIGQTGDNLADIPAKDPNIDHVYSVRAGKFRRYHGEGLKQLLDIPTSLKNFRDFFYVLRGYRQSRKLLKQLDPDVIFVKGGFVGVPVGLAAARLGIPYITHDSDAIPGLANRIIARWAAWHAVAMPAETYNYPQKQTITTGIPLQKDFVPVDDSLQQRYRQELELPAKAKVMFVIGGGLGSRRINLAIAEAVPHLMREFADLYVIQAAGRANEAEMITLYEERLNEAEQSRLQVYGYLEDVYRHSGAADLVVTRAGATNLAEFAQQGRACIVVPSSFLAAGHQLKNAEYLAKQGAAEILQEDDLTDDPNRLAKLTSQLLTDDNHRQKLADNFSKLAKPGADKAIADLILEQIKP